MAERERGITLTAGIILGLFFIQRYRFLTIEQFARVAEMKRANASNQLLGLERFGILGHFGNVGQRGYGKTPKVYYLKRKGYEALKREGDIPEELIGSHKETFVEAKWSPQMYHRLHTVDLMIAAEVGIRARSQLSMARTFIEYRRIKVGSKIMRETTDFVDRQEVPENRIIPDAAFVMENIETGKRGLFFIEMDMATERIVSQITRDRRITIHHKITQYDRYLTSGRFAHRYREHGEFRFFTLLFATIGDQRVDNIRREMHDLPQELSPYYRFTTYERATGDFFGPIWQARSLTDNERHPLVR